MTSIQLYQPPKINLQVNFPSSWDELNEKELFFIAKILLEQTEQNANETRALILKYIIFERAKDKVKLPPHWITLVDAEDFVINVYPLLDFIFEKNDRTISPKINGTTCAFENITCGEFEDCELAAFRFAEKPGQTPLAEIAAILFRADKVPYMQYNSRTDGYLTYQAEKKVKHFLKLKPCELYAMFIWYAGSKNKLPLIFPDLYNGGKKGEPDPMVFTNTIHAGAGPKNGSRNQIRCMKLYEFLYDCNQESKKAAELEAEYAKMQK